MKCVRSRSLRGSVKCVFIWSFQLLFNVFTLCLGVVWFEIVRFGMGWDGGYFVFIQCWHIVKLIPFRGIFRGKWDLGIFQENLGFFYILWKILEFLLKKIA